MQKTGHGKKKYSTKKLTDENLVGGAAAGYVLGNHGYGLAHLNVVVRDFGTVVLGEGALGGKGDEADRKEGLHFGGCDMLLSVRSVLVIWSLARCKVVPGGEDGGPIVRMLMYL